MSATVRDRKNLQHLPAPDELIGNVIARDGSYIRAVLHYG
jgi:hypothetical protein